MLIALGVSGGIAAYKACEIVRGLDRAGVEVQVILTRNGARFITPLTLQTLSRRKVLLDQFDLESGRTVQHIDLTRQISALVVAPATANILGKFAAGIADDFLSTFYVAVTAPVLVAPSMNTRMWEHPATQANLATLSSRGVRIVNPESGWLAEGETGWGRLAAPERIVEAVLESARRGRQLEGRKIVVTAGPTREAIDPVRFISNRSSGRMGFALAAAAAARGGKVTLISGPVALPTPHGVERVDVETAEQMRAALGGAREGAAAIFMAAAVSDYVPRKASSKLKKSGQDLVLELSEGVDILAEIGRERKGEILVGFAAETERVVENARAKLERKKLDYIVANDVSGSEVGIDSAENEVTILGRDGSAREVARAPKRQVAEAILDSVFGPPEDGAER